LLIQEEDVDAHALRARGWSITAIAAHLDRDRKTIRAYLAAERVASVRARTSLSAPATSGITPATSRTTVMGSIDRTRGERRRSSVRTQQRQWRPTKLPPVLHNS
jgi:transposase